jgi:hypothetical protein
MAMKELPAITQEQLIESMTVLCDDEITLMKQGNDEYAGGANAFGNFQRLADQLGLAPEMVLMVYAVKHMDGIMSYVNGYESQREGVTGRIKDLRVYLAILNAMVEARS